MKVESHHIFELITDTRCDDTTLHLSFRLHFAAMPFHLLTLKNCAVFSAVNGKQGVGTCGLCKREVKANTSRVYIKPRRGIPARTSQFCSDCSELVRSYAQSALKLLLFCVSFFCVVFLCSFFAPFVCFLFSPKILGVLFFVFV